MKTKTFVLKNTFHNTRTRFRGPEGDYWQTALEKASRRIRTRVMRELCGQNDCLCWKMVHEEE